MKRLLLTILSGLIVFACSNNRKSDEYLLEKDKKTLQESLDTRNVSFYKFFKVLIRASAETDTISEEFIAFKSDLEKISDKIAKNDTSMDLSIRDYLEIYQSYRKMHGFLQKTDEDIFPTLTEVIYKLSDDTVQRPRLRGDTKLKKEALEHSLLSVITLFSKDFGDDITLYECYKTETELLPDTELKAMVQLLRGFVFMQKGIFYLSEDEISRNINWLENHHDMDFYFTKKIFMGKDFDNSQAYLALHSFNYLLRGADRLMMDRKKDKKRALNDFKIFLNDSRELGADNEIIWVVETYLNLKEGETEKAIASLKKLENSSLISNREKKKIDESIQYLEKRESRKVLKGVFDKIFIAKITTSYLWGILSAVDLKQTLEENNVEYSEKMFRLLEEYHHISTNIEKYSGKEGLMETGNELKEKGKSLLQNIKK